MELEEYRRLIRSLPVERLHALAEQDPALAEAWAREEQARADAWAAAHDVAVDERAKEALLARLMDQIGQMGRSSQV